MCGIFGYIGKSNIDKNNAITTVTQGLQRLEYRGYDSWGLAIPMGNTIEVYKTLDPLQTADMSPVDLDGAMALGHTRWATHGAVNITNCHPHVSTTREFALVHNGIVENYQALKAKLTAQGVKLVSETDTEVIVRLIECELAGFSSNGERQKDSLFTSHDYKTALNNVFKKLKGRNTFVLICARLQLLLGIRNGSPLIAGGNPCNTTDGCYEEFFLASDYYSFSKHTNNCLFVDNFQMICCEKNKVELIDLPTNNAISPLWQILERQQQEHSCEGFSHFMLKEIQQQWETIPRAAAIDRNELELLIQSMGNANNIFITGAGAAFFIGEQIAAMLREIAGVFVTPIPAYESESYLASMKANDVLLAISQSGETADTLNFIEQAKHKGVLIASVVNMPGAMLSRLSDFAFLSYAGPEICVLSTKSSTSQLTFGYLLAKTINNQYELAKSEIEQLSQQLSHYCSDENLQTIAYLAQKITGDHIYLLGNRHFIGADKIGALNIKEASYIHAEAFPAGELKHGVIALIEKGTPVICFMDESNATYMTAIASEIKARGGTIIGISDQPNQLFDYTLALPVVDNPVSTVSHIIPCQLLAYYLAIQRGHNPDKPRNLAKSVTVI